MSSITIHTLGDLGPNFWLGASCESCFHFADIDRHELARRMGSDAVLDDIRRKLRCRQCGSREVLLYRGWDAGGFR